MTFPAATSATATGFGTAVTSTLPSGTSAGDLLVLIHARANATATTWPGTWTTILTNSANGSAFEVGYRWHQAGDSAPALTLGGSSAWCNRMFRLTGAHSSTPPAISAQSTATSTTPDPAVLDPANWAVEDTLWIAFCTYNTTADPTGYPSGYGDNAVIRNPSTTPSLATATLNSTTGSENPGTFTLPASTSWRAATIGIRPAGVAPAAAGNFFPFLM